MKHVGKVQTPYPQNNYAELKLKSEVLITKIIEETSVENIVLARLFNMYGYHDRFSIISKLINAINKEDEVNINNMGKSKRDFIFIDDTIRSIMDIINGVYIMGQ